MKFDNIVDRYDFLNHLLSAGQDFYWRRVMIRELGASKGDVILDLATGTGDSARAIVERGITVMGVDISFNMIHRAKQKIPDGRYSVVAGSAYGIPFKSDTFDGATCAFGIRNMHETPAALKEIHRVLKKGARMVFLEFSMPQGIIRGSYGFYLNRILPLVAGIFSERDAYDYLADSIEKFYAPDDFAKIILDAGFSRCDRMPLSFGCVYIHTAHKDRSG
ncbi:MAG TPA: ubiquinone/menaquinone biosynthesis methyltransferase [Dissulfurispiraceae bacterium]|nr:ubiquinone/menaquinone biosynthesis methyltransferase [Dissulfurispiraceae bacterium]